ncbi:LacI family DNA-binding transcriptional regulator [Microbacterium sp. B2969]|uniref:LacI family DNA-binding transcriptional regulator n=1 Tax=Microbacterium alkaliflavum TaxID=3248839 RepID=A0ABW7Q7F8_9MICO
MADEAPGRSKRPSIYDVAKLAGVSHMTVSRVLNGSPNIRPATKERVEAAMSEMHYRPSSVARSLATQRTMRIGAMVDAPSEYGPKTTLLALEAAARDRGYSIVPFSNLGDDEAEFEEGIAELERQGIDALCIIGPRISTPRIVGEVAATMPVILIGDLTADGLVHIDIDQTGGVTAAVDHLLELGHRSLLHLAGPPHTVVGVARERAFVHAVSGTGVRWRTVIGDWSSESGYALGASAEAVADATAVFAANDQMALGVMHGLWSRGLRVPDDVSVVGFDDMPGAAHFLPPLTTVRQDLYHLGEVVIETAISAIGGEIVHSATVPSTLVIRSSTGPPR